MIDGTHCANCFTMNCRKSTSVSNEYICVTTYGEDEEDNFGDNVVTWDGEVYTGFFSWDTTGTIDGDDLTMILNAFTELEWEKYEVGKI